MSPQVLSAQLIAAGRRINRWRAGVKLWSGVTGVMLVLWAFSLLDLWLRYERPGRIGIWLVLCAGSIAVLSWVQRAMAKKHSVQAVAAMIEGSFPQLDNHLINFLQFSSDTHADEFKEAYVKQGIPGWQGLRLDAMKNRKAHRRVALALGTAVVLFVAPGLFMGQAWGVAVWRILNPFSNTMPVSLTHILGVSPGNATVLQGSALVLSCKVQGWAGHKVMIDVTPDDKTKTTFSLGKIAGSDTEEFSYRLPKVNTRTTYRFRAGDAPDAEMFTVTTRPPLTFTNLLVTAKPPAYTRLADLKFEGLSTNLSVPIGSELSVQVRCNLPAKSLTLAQGPQESTMQATGGATTWQGSFTASNGTPARLVALGEAGDRIEQAIPCTVIPDRLPAIKVISPEGQSVLAPGASPEITFSAGDDYGLLVVTVEQVAVGSTREAKGTVLQTWKPDRQSKEFMQTWKGKPSSSKEGEVLAYRIVARDNCPFGDEEHITRSATIIFNAASAKQASEKRNALEKEAFEGLSRAILLEQQNIEKTRMYQKILASTTAEHWQDAAARQTEIREITKRLLSNPLNPLGGLKPTATKLYLAEMADVIPLLSSIPNTEEARKTNDVEKALGIEEKILRQLTFADSAAEKALVQQCVSAVSGLLARIIRGQTDVLKQTKEFSGLAAKVGQPLIDAQDQLARDVPDFANSCRTESDAVKGNDKSYSDLLLQIAEACESEKIVGDMMLACEKLEQNDSKNAIPHEATALEKLKKLEARIGEVVAGEEEEKKELMMEALEEVKKRFEKIKENHKKAVENMDAVAGAKDKSTKDVDMMEEEYKELMKNTKESLLQVPTDLSIFMELNVANDLVEDVFSVFEEVHQAGGSEQFKGGKVNEKAEAKREAFLEQMEEAKDRIDALEGWLGDKPDDTKFTTEAFDKEEMPKAGMALGALTTEAEDIIGDLLKEDKKLKDEAEDGAINTAVPDMLANNEIKEGDSASFAAQGKSGNNTPDHKEQDGRSNVGRQGQATGETSAGSGTIGEGDKEIEERRTEEPTQSGQVDVEGKDVQTKATGGGKLGTGKADALGMEGGVKRMDSTEAGSKEGLDQLMAKRADAMYAKASMQNIRADALKAAAHHLRQADDAVAKGYVGQVKEQRKLAVAALKQAKAQMDAAKVGGFAIQENPSLVEDTVEAGPDQAPPVYRDLVAEYYKLLNQAM